MVPSESQLLVSMPLYNPSYYDSELGYMAGLSQQNISTCAAAHWDLSSWNAAAAL